MCGVSHHGDHFSLSGKSLFGFSNRRLPNENTEDVYMSLNTSKKCGKLRLPESFALKSYWNTLGNRLNWQVFP